MQVNEEEVRPTWADVDDYNVGARDPQDVIKFLRDKEAEAYGARLAEPSQEAAELLALWQADNDLDVKEDGAEPIDWHAEYKRAALAEGDEAPPMMSKPQALECAEHMNDAEVLGEDHPDMAAILAKSFTFMTGDLYGQRDRRNTQDGDWKAVTAPLINWMVGSEGKNGKGAWGLTRHPVGKEKGGPSIVPSNNLDGARKDAAVETMYAIVLDIDSGESLDETIDKLIEQGLFAIVYTTFSHGKTEVELKHDDIMRKLGLEDSPTRPEIQEYLRLHHSGRYDRDFIAQIEVVDARRQTPNGMLTVIKTPAIDKFRVVLPLWEPVKLADLAPTLQKWKDVWADAVTGVAVNMLDVNFDSSSTDVNRLFYTPRHPKGDDNWYSAVIQGRPLRFEEIKPYSKDKFLRQRTAPGDPFLADTDGSSGASDVPLCMAPSGMSLNQWHREAKDRFMIADVLETYCADKLADADNKPGSVHIQCPFEHEHSSTGGSGTLAVNALDSDSEYWTVFCLHDSCKGRHKLEFLQQMLADEWFPEAILKDSSFLLPPADGAASEPVSLTADAVSAKLTNLTANSTDADIKAVFAGLIKEGADKGTINRAKEAITKATNGVYGKMDLKKLIKEVREEERASARGDKSDPIAVVNRWGDPDQAAYGEDCLLAARDSNDDPVVYQYEDDVAIVRGGKREMIGHDMYAAIVNSNSTWKHVSVAGDEEIAREVFAKTDVTKHMFNRRNKPYPELREVKRMPSFTADGQLVLESGYDPDTATFYDFGGLDVPPVSAVPTSAEIIRAKRLLIGDVLGDFPLDGVVDRGERLRRTLLNRGEPMSSAAHAVTLLLERPARALIHGATPGYGIAKYAPGTGGSRLMEVISLAVTGDEVAMEDIPTTDEEFTKIKSAIVGECPEFSVFDNPNDAIDSGPFASAITAPKMKARLLGSSRYVEAAVNNTWVVIANHLKASGEILRRFVMVEINARDSRPQDRGGWYHTDLKGWVREHRAELVWAILTLIQNWVAKGMKPWEGYSEGPRKGAQKGSFENWSRVMGGILRDAGIRGFLGNEDRLMSQAATGGDNGLHILMQHLAESYDDGQLIRPGGTAEIRGHKGAAVVSVKDELNVADDGAPLLLDGWGYSREDQQYNHARLIGQKWHEAARGVYRVKFEDGGEYDLSFSDYPDPKSRTQFYYVMHLRKI